MYYPISQDGQVQAYKQLRKQILAEEAARKRKQQLLRIELGLPDLKGEHGRRLHADGAFTYLVCRQQRVFLENAGKIE
jgi:hypothetical protein